MILKIYQKYQTYLSLNKLRMKKDKYRNLSINGNQFKDLLNIQTEALINLVQGCQRWDVNKNLQMKDKVDQGPVLPLKVKY